MKHDTGTGEGSGPHPSRTAVEHGWVRTAAVAVVAGAVGAALAGTPQNLSAGREAPIEAALAATYTVEAREGQSGTAVLVTGDGHLVTSAHIVDGLETVNLFSSSGERQVAVVVGYDIQSDIAVLRVGGNPLGALQFREGPVKAGEEVVAVGAPFGFRNTVTRGIISGDDRVLRMGGGQTILTGLIQTDASINPGNSGGPLIDTDGRIVGINTAISTSSGVSQGVGFAVPSGTVVRVIEDLIAGTPVAYGQLGVEVIDTLDRSGALISTVADGGSASEAGMRAGDIVTSADGLPVRTSGELVARIRNLRKGDSTTLTVLRYGETLTVRAELS